MKGELTSSFRKHDPEHTGMITATQWCDVMKSVTGLDLPWRTMKSKLVKAVSNDTSRVRRKELIVTSC